MALMVFLLRSAAVIWTRACALDKVIDAEGMGNVAVLGARCVTVPAHLAQRSMG